MTGRSDLASECVQGLPGERVIRRQENGVMIEKVKIENEEHAKLTGKPVGTYVTARFPSLNFYASELAEKAEPVARELSALLPETGLILAAGLGNRQITPDALGPECADKLLATRHIAGDAAKAVGLGALRPVAVISPGVLGQTGVETIELLRSVCERIRPAAVIVIDALAARETQHLGRTVQLCDTGISPGAGVGNDRPAINEKSLGVPVIGIGVPTVIDARTMWEKAENDLMVTPREIDMLIDRASKLIACAVNLALQPDFDPVDLMNAV